MAKQKPQKQQQHTNIHQKQPQMVYPPTSGNMVYSIQVYLCVSHETHPVSPSRYIVIGKYPDPVIMGSIMTPTRPTGNWVNNFVFYNQSTGEILMAYQ